MKNFVSKADVVALKEDFINVYCVESFDDSDYENIWSVFKDAGIASALDDDFKKRADQYAFIMLAMEGDKPVGLVTVKMARFSIEEEAEEQLVVLSGIVVVPEYQRGNLARELIRLTHHHAEEDTGDYWHIQFCGNWKAYLLALAAYDDFVPRPEKAMTSTEKKVRDVAGKYFYGVTYEDGLVAPPPGVVNPEWRTPIDPQILATKERAKFFADTNSKYQEGYSLAIIRRSIR